MITHKIIFGDCLDKMKDIPNDSVDLICADLPYGTTGCKWDSIIPFEPLWEEYERIIKKQGAIVLTASQPFTSALVMSNPKLFKYELIWEKSRASNFVHANYQPLKAHENICVFSKSGAAQGSKNPMVYNPQLTDGKPYHKGYVQKSNDHLIGGNTTYPHSNKTGKRKPRSVKYFSSDSDGKDRGLHPTQKTVELIEYLIKTYSNEGDLVLDNTAGSGTTGVAAINTNRNFILIENDEKYFDVIKNRLNPIMHENGLKLHIE